MLHSPHKAGSVAIEFHSGAGSKVLKEGLDLQAGEVIDASFMSKRALYAYLEKEIADARESDIMLSLHLKATMMKISDPIIDAVTVWSSRHAAREIETRFTVCLLADPVSAERGSQTNYTSQTVWGEIGTRVDCGQAQPSDLNIISIASIMFGGTIDISSITKQDIFAITIRA